MYERPGYRSLLGRIRANVRTYIRKQLELPRQEIEEIIRANLRAVGWFAAAAGLVFLGTIALVVTLIATIALLPREWLGTAVLALFVGSAAALTVAAFRIGGRIVIAVAVVADVLLVAVGVVALAFFPELLLSAILLTLSFFVTAGLSGYRGYKRLELHGPTRTITSIKETVRWAKARLLGRSAS